MRSWSANARLLTSMAPMPARRPALLNAIFSRPARCSRSAWPTTPGSFSSIGGLSGSCLSAARSKQRARIDRLVLGQKDILGHRQAAGFPFGQAAPEPIHLLESIGDGHAAGFIRFPALGAIAGKYGGLVFVQFCQARK